MCNTKDILQFSQLAVGKEKNARKQKKNTDVLGKISTFEFHRKR